MLLGETDGETAVSVRAAFVELYGRRDGYVTHLFGRSFRRISCPTTCRRRKPFSMTEVHDHVIPYSTEEIGDAPEGHDAICFECSGATPPAGWSQAERAAYQAAIAAREPRPLRIPARITSPGEVGSRAQRRAMRPARDNQ